MTTLSYKWYSFFWQKEVRVFAFLIALFLLGAAFLGSLTPYLIKNLSDSFNHTSTEFLASLKNLFFNFVLLYVNRVAFQLTVNKYIREIIHLTRSKVFSNWLMASEINGDKYPQGEIISRIINDSEAIRELITSGAFGLFIDLFFVGSCLISFIKLHPVLGGALSLFEFIAIALLIWGSTLMRVYFTKLRSTQALVNRTTANVVGGIKQLYYAENDNFADIKTDSAFKEFLHAQNKANAADALYYAIAESLYPITLVFTAFVLPFSGFVVSSLLMAMIDLIQRSINPIKEISGKISNLQRAHTGLVRLESFLNDLSHDHVVKVDDRLSFSKLSVRISEYCYPNIKNDVQGNSFKLSNVHFSGKSGELIGIVGLSGSGKSTLMNILSGSLILEKGEFEVFTKEKNFVVKNSSSLDWVLFRNQVSLVSQDSHIFSESLFFNLSMGYGSIDDFSKAWSFFEEKIPYLKKWGLTPTSKIEPQKLSLGQRQLIAGLRACYLRKNIVLFDEISSAMDSDLELALRSLILILQEHSLTIIVAHRLETLINSNLILVMENGRLEQSGTHAELLTSSKTYKEFIKELSLSA